MRTCPQFVPLALASLALLLACTPTPPAQPARIEATPAPAVPAPAAPQITVKLPSTHVSEPVQGRLLVLLAASEAAEPRYLLTEGDDTAQLYGLDVDAWAPGTARSLTGDVAGYPQPTLATIPPGEYTIQAVLHRYELFNRADGHTVALPPDRGEGQQWNSAPGNLYSTPKKLRVDATSTLELELDQIIPPLPPITDTPLLRHVEIESPLLTKFWGRSMKLGARVLLPKDWDKHPDAHYPLLIYHSHFGRDLAGYRDTPADPSLPPVDRDGLARECPNGHGAACEKYGYPRMVQEGSYAFHQTWISDKFPRVILIQIEHANPYYDDSYAVNSANVGPYGDAITHELIPHIEREFRGLGAWARGMYGGSTGGWEAIAAQVFYPDEYNGAVGNCPDPLDFRAYMTIDIYNDDNAYYSQGPFRTTPRVATRNPDGTTKATVEQNHRAEAALGSRGRSGQQFDIWEAVYSPVGPDGYPKPLYDRNTGVIDKAVAAHWREHYDIGHILTRDWATLGPKLRGKLWLNTGDMDSFFLERSVRLVEARLQQLESPPPDVPVVYGHGHGHCWSGDPDHMNFESRLTYHARFIPLLVGRFLRTAPAGADTTSWRY